MSRSHFTVGNQNRHAATGFLQVLLSIMELFGLAGFNLSGTHRNEPRQERGGEKGKEDK